MMIVGQKILVAKPALVSPTNGGDLCLLERLGRLIKAGHSVKALSLVPKGLESTVSSRIQEWDYESLSRGYRTQGIDWEIIFVENFDPDRLQDVEKIHPLLERWISHEKPDWLWSHYTDYIVTMSFLASWPEKTWVDVTDNEYPRLAHFQAVPQMKQIYGRLQNILVASAFMQNQVKIDFPTARIAVLLNPLDGWMVEMSSWEESAPWLMINPIPVKGAEFFASLAAALPSHNFLAVTNWGQKPSRTFPSNVRLVERQQDPRALYRQSRGVLVPSLWEEAFGRVALEAMAMGRVVISSDRGALPQTVGAGGLVLPLDLEFWTDALQKNDAFYEGLIEQGAERWRIYRAEVDQSFLEYQAVMLK
jgi:hypothetical protein